MSTATLRELSSNQLYQLPVPKTKSTQSEKAGGGGEGGWRRNGVVTRHRVQQVRPSAQAACYAHHSTRTDMCGSVWVFVYLVCICVQITFEHLYKMYVHLHMCT